MHEHLYNAKDVTRVRNLLLEEQGGIDPITKTRIPKGKEVLDHCHDTQFVRAVLHNHSNVSLGKIENLWARYMAWWYRGTLPDFLRGCADYLEREQPSQYLHPMHLKRLQIEFNKLPEGKKNETLVWLGQGTGTNGAERKTLFRKALLKKDKDYFMVLNKIKNQRGEL